MPKLILTGEDLKKLRKQSRDYRGQLADLRADIAKSFEDLEHDRVYNASEVRANLDI